jgi:hypothetical protein
MSGVVLQGQCPCGAVHLELTATRPPAELPVRVCACSYCRKHGARYTSDPAGSVDIVVADPADLGRYRFGLGLADFLFCRCCGGYLGAHEPGSPGRAVINLLVLDDAPHFVAVPSTMDYDTEDEAARRARRARAWTPARIAAPGAAGRGTR